MSVAEQLEVGRLYHLRDGARVSYDSHIWEYDPRTQLLWMFCYHKDESSWKSHRTLRLEMRAPSLRGSLSSEEAEAWYYGHAQVMHLLVYAATLGWDLFDAPDEKFGYDHIAAHGHLQGLQHYTLEEIRRRVNLDEGSVRELTKVDVLRAAHSVYREQGAEALVTLPNIRNSYDLRVHVQWPLLESCAQDLVAEGLLETTQYKQAYRAHPGKWIGIEAEIHRRDERVHQRITEAAELNGWEPSERAPALGTDHRKGDPMSPNRVFIIHGHDEAKRRELKDLLVFCVRNSLTMAHMMVYSLSLCGKPLSHCRLQSKSAAVCRNWRMGAILPRR